MKRLLGSVALAAAILIGGATSALAASPVLTTPAMIAAQGDGANVYSVPQFTDLPDFRAATTAPGTLVMYDIEGWTRTPASEYLRPRAAMRTFIAEAHARGILVMLAPGFDRLHNATDCSTRRHETTLDAYLRCFAPLHADELLVPSQSLQCTPRIFSRELAAVAAISPAKVIAELTVMRPLDCITPARLIADAHLVAGFTDGLSIWGLGGVARPPIVRPDVDQITILTAILAGL